MKGRREYERSKCWEAGVELGRALSSDCHSKSGSLLLRRPGGKILTSTVENSQLEEILPVNVMCRKKWLFRVVR